MLVGRLAKQPLQVSRFTVNFSEYLDANEQIVDVTTPVISIVGSGWQGPFLGGPLTLPPPPPPPDTNPLELVGTYTLIDEQMVQVFLQHGTIGLVYQVQFVITGQSTRQLPVEVQVQVNAP